jgi:2-succinyl-5-enolpyruvyl-6-hydroxy-3-cyclohexene-1-carboxylate synthase
MADDVSDPDPSLDSNSDDATGPTEPSDPPDPVSAPNRNTLWSRLICEELVAAGVSSVCFAPGSRSTPLTAAAIAYPDIETFSHLDERSAAFFALGRGRRGELTPVICTSGTATAEFHPAVIEADEARVPLLLLTADRPPELADNGANQTIDQEKLYGDAVRTYHDLPEPGVDARKLRSLRTTVSRAVATARGTPPGPVHLNARFRKPLEPVATGDIPTDLAERAPLGVRGRDGPFVYVDQGRPQLDPSELDALTGAIADADRGLLVAGPADPPRVAGEEADYADAIARLARATGFPLLADPLSGLRFGSHTDNVLVCGGYDSYLASAEWPDPDLVVRVGASPTSKVLRQYLRDAETRQLLVDPAGKWREATFTATDLLVADPARLACDLADRLGADQPTSSESGRNDRDDRSNDSADADSDDAGARTWATRFADAESRYWDLLDDAHDERFFEGTVLADVAALAPDRCTLFVSNSMPIRDIDRFGEPHENSVTALANRGASGIDGITSTGLGAGSVDDDPLVLVLGDLAYYHDMNGLLAVSRCGVDATIVLIDNDGGGIFHKLPIADFDPPFTEGFVTPHGLDFAPTGDLYGVEFTRTGDRETFRERYSESLSSAGTQVIAVEFDGEESHDYRETVHERACTAIGDGENPSA